jgi:hypothetical protein
MADKTYSFPVQIERLPLYVNVRRAAELLDCSTQSITKLIRTKMLPATYLRGTTSVRVKVADLLAMMGMEPYDPKNTKNPKKAARRLQ